MNDRELLTLAAKAAGYEINFDEPVNGWYPHGYDDGGDVDKWWNPLTDDGDALRLAVAAHIDISEVQDWYSTDEEFEKDPLPATRRAIVRAAAEIGRAT